MAKVHELYLTVKETDEADFGKSLIRMRGGDKPPGIEWGDKISLSLDKNHWITTTLEPADNGTHNRIYIGIHLRGLLNKDTTGLRLAKLEVPCFFYIKQKPFWHKLFLG
ncbi:hypothetical protein ACFLXP_01675 [Chloroflexota bacterium]